MQDQDLFITDKICSLLDTMFSFQLPFLSLRKKENSFVFFTLVFSILSFGIQHFWGCL